ncbi:Rho termination factor N-terminal domain-containing protein [Hymenobacter qilianensis]|uniref:Rho termination factor N-terminal domain-containing protein n=1 Tax=Hymenobacter qilianensis TaxID=1385715 RepID=UPI003744873B
MYNIEELKDRLLSELKEIAEELKVGNFKKLSKQDLIYKILDQQAIIPADQLPQKMIKPASAKNGAELPFSDVAEADAVPAAAPAAPAARPAPARARATRSAAPAPVAAADAALAVAPAATPAPELALADAPVAVAAPAEATVAADTELLPDAGAARPVKLYQRPERRLRNGVERTRTEEVAPTTTLNGVANGIDTSGGDVPASLTPEGAVEAAAEAHSETPAAPVSFAPNAPREPRTDHPTAPASANTATSASPANLGSSVSPAPTARASVNTVTMRHAKTASRGNSGSPANRAIIAAKTGSRAHYAMPRGITANYESPAKTGSHGSCASPANQEKTVSRVKIGSRGKAATSSAAMTALRPATSSAPRALMVVSSPLASRSARATTLTL